jgi:hypothetical protein
VVIRQAMIARCVRPIFLVDSGKWGEIAPYTITPMETGSACDHNGQKPPGDDCAPARPWYHCGHCFH